ncbi:Thioredoxin domain-containing protein 3-like protein [Trichoplax sp. H2]|nr:Thioredoxin domain-containing protein 3-like protein [Trichoplax sp. H2]|eukprot:RDD43712.1 Thioredoxin domain-containing protein 3-like protein [Trichoplax sp. H2]
MARKKVDIQFQTVVQTNAQWEELLSTEGLKVVDVYSAWCGPCKSIASTLRKVRNEIGDDFLQFAVAESDNIDQLSAYRNKSQPTFLFYGGETLVSIVRGANVPLLVRQIHEQLDKEHQVHRYGIHRIEVIDLEIQRVEEERLAEEERKQYEIELEKRKVPKEVTIAIIKPDAVQEGKMEEIIDNLTEAGIMILKQEIRILTTDEATELYKEHQDTDYYEQLIDYMTSGPCCVLILSKDGVGDGIINEWKEIIGPPEAAEEKEQYPEAWRSLYGTDAKLNGLHGSDSLDNAARELAFFFPDFSVPKVIRSRPQTEERPPSRLQRTLALIRPETDSESKQRIIGAIEDAGFTIAIQKEIQLTREEAEEFYREHKSKDYFEKLITRMTSGPLVALALAKQDSVDAWRDMIGPPDVNLAKELAPSSLRARYSSDDVNVVHGSENHESAEKELEFFFPERKKTLEKTLAVIKPDGMENKEKIIQEIENAGFNIAMQEETVLTKELASKFYKEHEGKDFFDSLTSLLSSGPSLFMILEKEEAVSGFRKMIGCNDPDVAKQKDPTSLRAMFGSNIVSNALHGSTSYEEAVDKLGVVFGSSATKALKVGDEGNEEEAYGDDFEEQAVDQTDDGKPINGDTTNEENVPEDGELEDEAGKDADFVEEEQHDEVPVEDEGNQAENASTKEDGDTTSLHQSDRSESAHPEIDDNKSTNDQDSEQNSEEAQTSDADAVNNEEQEEVDNTEDNKSVRDEQQDEASEAASQKQDNISVNAEEKGAEADTELVASVTGDDDRTAEAENSPPDEEQPVENSQQDGDQNAAEDASAEPPQADKTDDDKIEDTAGDDIPEEKFTE